MNIAALVHTITKACHAYYNGRDSNLTDHDYDRFEEQLRQVAPDHPIFKEIGAPVTILTKVSHGIHMGSQNKASTPQEFDDWYTGVGVDETTVGTLKLDGFSLALYYECGHFKCAITRGDGFYGEDISANAVEFKRVPLTLPDNFTGAIRGEGVMTMTDWAAVDPDKESNPRNLAAGIARRKDGTDANRISFYAFDITATSIKDISDELSKLCIMEQLGFTVVPHSMCLDQDDAIAFFNRVTSARTSLDFWIDGVIFKVNDLVLQEDMGMTDNRPKGQIAWKFESEEATTTVEEVVLTVGHTGKIIPTARVRPVQIGGTTVTNALLCNWEEITRLDVAIGDQVVMIKAGDIIPKIIKVTHRPEGYSMPAGMAQAGARKPIPVPIACPVCNGPAGKQKNSGGDATADIYCLNDECPAKASGKIKRWIKSLDIQGIGDEVLDALTTVGMLHDEPSDTPGFTRMVDHPLVRSIADVYRLKDYSFGAFSNLMVNGKRLGTKRAASVLAEIDKTRTLTIDQFLGSLGLKHLGKRKVTLIREAARALCPEVNALAKVDGWLRASPLMGSYLIQHADKLGIPGIAQDIQEGLDQRLSEIMELTQLVTITVPASPAKPVGGPLVGQSFVLTGAMSRPRKEIAEAILAAGGVVKDDVVAGLTALVQADSTSKSTKSQKAQKLGVKVISEEVLWQLCGKDAK